MSKPLVEAVNLSVRFESGRGGVEALQDAYLEASSGESIAIVGESGSGKTTLLRACLALVPPFGGSVTLFGQDISACGRRGLVALRRRCGYIPQDPFGCVPPTLSAMEAVAEPILIAGSGSRTEARKKAGDLLIECGLDDPDLWKERVRLSLSGGQRQRVSIARALALDPELLFADEPASMQDAATRGEVLRILKRRTQKGMGMVMATHDLLLAASAASRVMVLYMGRVVEKGPAKSILESPLHPYSKALVAAIPGMGHAPELFAQDPEKTPEIEGCDFGSRCPCRTGRCKLVPQLMETGGGRHVACWETGGY
ncbi:MAG: ABC transporter ATP-binding protein [Thermovirgaceae bacterium]|nr:ABC transporter ATP-binding protein [Thermovirgaceae bacterium]